MESSFDKSDITRAGFHDIHGFKDFVSMVALCAPNHFLYQPWRAPDDQLTLEKAFASLEYGFRLIALRFGEESEIIKTCQQLAHDAYLQYTAGNLASGRELMNKLRRTVRRIPTE